MGGGRGGLDWWGEMGELTATVEGLAQRMMMRSVSWSHTPSRAFQVLVVCASNASVGKAIFVEGLAQCVLARFVCR